MTGTRPISWDRVTSKGEAEPVRFYSMNVVDLATRRCATQPLFSRSGNAVYAAFWAIWQRLGMPRHLQVDNEMAFYGSPTHPRGHGAAHPLVPALWHHPLVHPARRTLAQWRGRRVQLPLPTEIPRPGAHADRSSIAHRRLDLRAPTQQSLSLQPSEGENTP